MADSKGENPDFEEPDQPGNEWDAAEPVDEVGFGEPVDEVGFGEPVDEVGFGEPIEEMDFTEPADSSFPSDAIAEDTLSVDGEVSEAVTSLSGLGLTSDQEPIIAGEGVPEVEEVVEEFEEEAKPQRGKTLLKWLARLEIPGVLLIAVAIWFVTHMITENVIWHAAFLILLGLIPYSLWKTRKYWTTPEITASYTVMLAIGAAALLSAVYWLGLELFRYDWDIKAKRAKDSVGAVSVAQFTPPDMMES